MKKLFQRLIVFFIGLPALLSVVVFFPQQNHLLLNLVTITFSILGAVELRNILAYKKLVVSLPETIILGALSPLAWTIVVSFGVAGHIVAGAYILGAFWLLVSKVFSSIGKLDSYIGHIAAGFTIMIYPGLFMAWIVQMAVLSDSRLVILIFFIVVLLNDAMAWVAGVSWGKNNRGIIAASPNKSIAGFIGGITASLIAGAAAVMIFPHAFTSKLIPPIPAGLILGFCTGIAAILGDLSESALKRSAGVKDSGNLILGRGGALDVIDSLSAAAPVYYIIYQVLF